MSIFEVAHYSGLVPLVWYTALAAFGRRLPLPYLLVALGVAVSVPADSVMKLMGGSFDVTFYYVPVQVILILSAFGKGALDRASVSLAVLCGGAISLVYAAQGMKADVLDIMSGSVAICVLAWKENLLTWPLLVYFGAGTVAYLWMVPTIGTDAIYPRWLAYQACRWVAFALFVLTTASAPRRRRVHA